MKILKNKKKTILAVLALFFAFLMIGPFLPVLAANNAKIDAPGDEWDGEIAESVPAESETKQDVEDVTDGDNMEKPDSSSEVSETVLQEPTQPEVVVEKVVTNIVPPATTSRDVVSAPAITNTDVALQNSVEMSEKNTVEEVDEKSAEISSDSKFNMEVVELLELPESEEEILIPETGNLDRNKALSRAKRIGLMSLSASGIIFFTGVMVWAAWKLKNLSTIETK